ncbi:hypothetical protein, partial [Staphylococcus aureus]
SDPTGNISRFFQAEDGIRDRSVSRGLGDVYKRQMINRFVEDDALTAFNPRIFFPDNGFHQQLQLAAWMNAMIAVSYTHLRAHETLSDLVCRLLLEKNSCFSS